MSRDDAGSSYGPSAPGKGRLRGLREAGEELTAAAAAGGSRPGGEKKNGEASFPVGDDGSASKEAENEDPKSEFVGRP